MCVAARRTAGLSATDADAYACRLQLLTDDECDWLVKRARSSFARSTVVGQNGGGAVDPIRNSEGTWINRRSDPVMTRINARISLITHLPVDHQEDMQILKYEEGQHYYPHNDWFHTAPEKSEENGKQRWITILHYLNNYGDDYTGGEARSRGALAPDREG
jgi:prolyl 4-hydroxylase